MHRSLYAALAAVPVLLAVAPNPVSVASAAGSSHPTVHHMVPGLNGGSIDGRQIPDLFNSSVPHSGMGWGIAWLSRLRAEPWAETPGSGMTRHSLARRSARCDA